MKLSELSTAKDMADELDRLKGMMSQTISATCTLMIGQAGIVLQTTEAQSLIGARIAALRADLIAMGIEVPE